MKRICLLGVIVLFCPSVSVQETTGPAPPFLEASKRLSRLIEHERATREIPAISIVVVSQGEVLWAQGFGEAVPASKTPATAETAYRVGSVSKLITDLALMGFQEKGEIDLDAPVERYLPDFHPETASAAPITLRQLVSHRSGICREPPVGHYFDPTSPTLLETVASLNRTASVYPPGAKTKYSNAGLAVVGRVVETLARDSFVEVARKRVLEPLGMTHSSFDPTPELARSMARGVIWTEEGRVVATPTFLLGTSSAGNLVSTANDLGKFLIAITGDGGGIVRPETLKGMFSIQYADPKTTSGFGLGFAVSRFDGALRVGHGGAVYGFSTEVAALPEEKIGVAVMASKDCVNGVTTRIADEALRMVRALRSGKDLPEPVLTEPVDASLARQLEGVWNGPAVVEFDRKGNRVFARTLVGPDGLGNDGPLAEVRRRGDEIYLDGPLAGRVRFGTIDPTDRNVILNGSNRWVRREKKPETAPPEPKAEWKGLIGEYGWDHNILYVFEEGGQLRVLIEWFFPYTLRETKPDHFDFPESGLYAGESVVFRRDASGRAVDAIAANVVFKRREIAGEDGSTFRIKPLRPVAELTAESLKATPPREEGERLKSDLVDLMTLGASWKYDIRYATENNFLGTAVYSSPRAFLQRPAAVALQKANESLARYGFGLTIHDAYRPWHITRTFWEATPVESREFVADPAKGSKHNRGCAVDVSLHDLKTQEPVEMVGGYDEFSARSNPDYPGGTASQRWRRDVLRSAMEEAGFSVNEVEWWHFDFRDWARYPIGNATFEELSPSSPPLRP